MALIDGHRYTEVKTDEKNLYREETFTDMTYTTIRRLTPIKADGSVDEKRDVVFIGMVQLMSPNGPIPVHCVIDDATTLEEAIALIPDAVESKVREMITESQQEEGSRIITTDD